MARAITKQCQQCALLSAEEAQRLHGAEGDGCWNPNRCPRRRSHYRHRPDINAKRRGKRAEAKAEALAKVGTGVAVLQVPVQLPAIALVYLYREKRKDAHLHAIAVTVWRGGVKLAEIPPIHCMGMTNSQVNKYLREALKMLGEQYGITEFEPEIYLDPTTCPLAPCPLQSR